MKGMKYHKTVNILWKCRERNLLCVHRKRLSNSAYLVHHDRNETWGTACSYNTGSCKEKLVPEVATNEFVKGLSSICTLIFILDTIGMTNASHKIGTANKE